MTATENDAAPLSADAMRATGRAITDWYHRNRRDLPWRRTRDPYAVWVSEIMLQQTRVESVVGYYDRFIREFPDTAALAAASPERVLKAWEGLGYYSRAHNLRRGAQYLMQRFGGALPASRDELIKIPGVGRYTAAAIASIAFNLPEPAVDGNVLRVVARLFAVRSPVNRAPVRRSIESIVRDMIPEGESGSFCQALMELGALICLPGQPICARCPVESRCAARQQGLTGSLPIREPRKKPLEQTRIVAVIERRGKILIRQRPPKGLLARMWEFPGWDHDKGGDALSRIAERLSARGLRIESADQIGDSRHVFTHRVWLMRGWHVRVAGQLAARAGERWVWPDDLGNYPFPAAMRNFLDWVEQSIRSSRQ